MQIHAISPYSSSAGIKKYNNYTHTSSFKKLQYVKDSFEKQNSDVSFTGFRKKKANETRIEKNLADSLKSVSIKGMPFLLGLAASAAMVKMGDGAKDLLSDKDGYLVSPDGVSSDMINIDEKAGIIKFEGTGIEIKADDYDYVDWENGVFRNFDGSVDIDLGANKFIDTENGIFVDPAEKIAAVLDREHFENIAIPHFPSFGSGYPTTSWDDRWGTIQSRYTGEYENSSALDKATLFIKNLFNRDSLVEDVAGAKDIFGNDIMTATDSDGDTYLTSMPRGIINDPVFAKFQTMLGGDKETAVETFNNARLRTYLEENFPSFGTRVLAYEGGRHSNGGHIAPEHERYDGQQVQEVLDKISEDGGYFPDPGSEEAINFVKYQNIMLKSGFWEKPLISPNMLLDADGDGKPDIDIDGDGIPDYDINGDGIIDLSSKSGGGILGALLRFFKGSTD